MNLPIVASLLAKLCLIVTAALLPSALCSAYYGEGAMAGWFVVSGGLAGGPAGLVVYATRRAGKAFHQREAIVLVCFSWIAAGVVGALPFALSGALPFVPALFESVSGFTTCGASVLDDIESLPRGLLFWRSFTHWMGGFGILASMLLVLPHLGTGGKMLFRFESSQGIPKGLHERLRKSVYAILVAYLLLTAAQTAALLLTGRMDLFESLCHTFGTLATGGFSTRQASIAAYDSVAVELIITFFMLCGATSFSLHSMLLRGNWRAFHRDAEWRLFMLIYVVTVLLCTANVAGWFGESSFDAEGGLTPATTAPVGHALRASSFAVASIMTNTGFATDDFDSWPLFSRAILLVVMTIGGCAGSTAGGVKVVRLLILIKAFLARVEASYRQRIVRVIRVDDYPIGKDAVLDACVFFAAYVGVFAAGVLVMSAWGLPLDSSVSSVLSCMSCTGPGLELVGPSVTYSFIPDGGLLALIALMLLGRLELFTFLALVAPSFWRVGR